MERLMKLTAVREIIISNKTWASLITTRSINLTLLQKFYILKSEDVGSWRKKFMEYAYWTCVIGSSIPNEIKQNKTTMVKALK